ncbi:hypothetical protein ACH5RR_003372 [Cinchona calisaya]|uniref:Uncharacterized protein n=1 Tax=Cinchona calisaya TaxID=153742 RepID=A0ABD3AUN0_9GENT
MLGFKDAIDFVNGQSPDKPMNFFSSNLYDPSVTKTIGETLRDFFRATQNKQNVLQSMFPGHLVEAVESLIVQNRLKRKAHDSPIQLRESARVVKNHGLSLPTNKLEAVRNVDPFSDLRTDSSSKKEMGDRI